MHLEQPRQANRFHQSGRLQALLSDPFASILVCLGRLGLDLFAFCALYGQAFLFCCKGSGPTAWSHPVEAMSALLSCIWLSINSTPAYVQASSPWGDM